MTVKVHNKAAGKPKGSGGTPPRRDRSDELLEVWQALDALSAAAVEREGRYRRDAESMRETISEADSVVLERLTAVAEGHESAVEELRSLVGEYREEGQRVEAQVRSLSSAVEKRDGVLQARIDELPTHDYVVETVTESREKQDNTVGHVVERITGMCISRDARLDEVAARLEEMDRAFNKRADVLENRISEAAGAREIEEAAQAVASSVDQQIRATFESVDDRVSALGEQVESVKGTLAELGRIVDRQFERAGEENTAISERLDALRATVASVDEVLAECRSEFRTRIEGVESSAQERADNFDEVVARIRDAESLARSLQGSLEQVAGDFATRHQEVVNHSNSVISALPTKLMLNSRGVLVAIDGTGEVSEIGSVVGRDGADGATILDARIADGLLEFVMSDQRCLRVKFPVAVEQPIGKDDGQDTRGRRNEG